MKCVKLVKIYVGVYIIIYKSRIYTILFDFTINYNHIFKNFKY